MRAVFVSLFLFFVAQPAIADDDMRFASVDIYLNSTAPVAAWQFELDDRNGVMQIVGVENGESGAFERAPYYDREAVQLGNADRIIVADYSLADESELPSGRVRIATLHMVLSGTQEPEFDLRLVTAATYDGQVIDASIDLDRPTGSEQ